MNPAKFILILGELKKKKNSEETTVLILFVKYSQGN